MEIVWKEGGQETIIIIQGRVMVAGVGGMVAKGEMVRFLVSLEIRVDGLDVGCGRKCSVNVFLFIFGGSLTL